MDKFEKWRGYVPESELETYRKGGFTKKIGIGRKPALLNIDTTWMFVDPAYSQCGAEMPEMIEALVRLTEAFRSLDLPIYYSRRDNRAHPTYRGIWNLRLSTAGDKQYSQDARADEWPARYAPRDEDRIILKNKPSSFFHTPLESFLRYDEVDTVIACGISTSGCVRAGVVDAFSHNFRTIVAGDACGDRSAAAHKANLFDMDMKFADVESTDDITRELIERFRGGVANAAE